METGVQVITEINKNMRQNTDIESPQSDQKVAEEWFSIATKSIQKNVTDALTTVLNIKKEAITDEMEQKICTFSTSFLLAPKLYSMQYHIPLTDIVNHYKNSDTL